MTSKNSFLNSKVSVFEKGSSKGYFSKSFGSINGSFSRSGSNVESFGEDFSESSSMLILHGWRQLGVATFQLG